MSQPQKDIMSLINESMGVLTNDDQHIAENSSLSVTLLYFLVFSNCQLLFQFLSSYSFPPPLPLPSPST